MRAVTRGSDLSQIFMCRDDAASFVSIFALLGHGLLLLLRRVGGLCAEAARACGTRGHPALLQPDVEKRGHWFQLLVAQQTKQSSHVYEMDEAGVELLVSTQVPELEPMGVVDVSVASKHLAVNVTDVVCELGREARGLAQPVVGV